MNNTLLPFRFSPRRLLVAALLLITYLPLAAATVSPGCGTPTYTQYANTAEGLIVMEAERATRSAASQQAGHSSEVTWTERTRGDASDGGYAIVATKAQHAGSLPANGARLEYDIEFTRSGTYYLYLRHAAPNSNDNSVRVALDGVLFEEELQLDVVSGGNWTWQQGGSSFTINSRGTHTLTIYHREDGLPLDKVVLSTFSGRALVGTGPTTTEVDAAAARDIPTYEQDTTVSRNLIVMEAELPTNFVGGRSPFTCREWTVVSDAEASNEAYAIVPEAGERSDSATFNKGPRLEFAVKFFRTGRHYVYVRHRGTVPGKNSIWTDFNYADEDEFHLDKNAGNWDWETDGTNASFVVATPGTYVFSILMREDGTPIDKIILSTSSTYAPSGTGPATTECVQPIVYQQDDSNNRLVVMPAETPSSSSPGQNAVAGLEWENFSDPDAEGGTYTVVNTTGKEAKLNDDGPALTYEIDFNTTGDHYIYVRHRSVSSGNSVRFFFDGVRLEDMTDLRPINSSEWNYTRVIPTINVPTAGRHTLTMRMREDGTPIDQLIISRSPTFDASAMPVTLTDFSGTVLDEGNLLSWTTAHEDHTATHIIERSPGGKGQWETVGQVAAAGTSNRSLDYQLTDRAPLPLAYYRLRTVDLDGSTSFSPLIRLARTQRLRVETTLELYPNPAHGHTTIAFALPQESEAVVRLHDFSGQLLTTRSIAGKQGTNRLTLDLGHLPPGTYSVSARVNGALLLRRLTVQ